MSNMDKPRFTVIEGDSLRQSEWRCPPAVAIGRGLHKRDVISTYRVSEEAVRKALEIGRRQPLLDLWWHIHGKIPPVPGADRYSDIAGTFSSDCFQRPHAAFRGVMRPNGEDDRGFDYLAFVAKPRIGFFYEPSMSCLIRPYDIPDDLVFVSYVKLDFPEGRRYHNSRGKNSATSGVITHWQFVESDPRDPKLPLGYDERFRRRQW